MKAAGKYNVAHSLNHAAAHIWPASRRSLTWAVAPGTRKDAIDPLAKQSIEPWSVASGRNFTFKCNSEKNYNIYNASDIKISSRTKATDPALDGKGNVIAYGTPPTEGIMVLDGDETWAPGPLAGATDIGSVGLHEMGNILALEHSSDEKTVMFPSIGLGVRKGLGESDIAAPKNLYGF
ncbi:hypothetical protein Tsubulata_024345 [Turnera subulata]|uniref:Peptidase M10 metallopeptidase domain-containing protein n=1 Tax=Turnera subulata TaxID=218843 RepID=A0A9Q0GIB0_9ROSI|nr:hypothetical protein Tsubulata_024345 [Turnera subulata]